MENFVEERSFLSFHKSFGMSLFLLDSIKQKCKVYLCTFRFLSESQGSVHLSVHFSLRESGL